MPASLFSYGGSRQNTGFVVFAVLQHYNQPCVCQYYFHGSVQMLSIKSFVSVFLPGI